MKDDNFSQNEFIRKFIKLKYAKLYSKYILSFIYFIFKKDNQKKEKSNLSSNAIQTKNK